MFLTHGRQLNSIANTIANSIANNTLHPVGLFLLCQSWAPFTTSNRSFEFSLVNVLGSGQWSEEVVPTVAFNLRQVRKGNVTMKVWDVAVSDPLMRGFGHVNTFSSQQSPCLDWPSLGYDTRQLLPRPLDTCLVVSCQNVV
jgi:hypothetical protein